MTVPPGGAANGRVDISVVTPTRDKRALLERTLASLAAQDLPQETYEVVVVDDGSTDETPRFLAAHAPGHGFRWVRLKENRGRAAARNRGLERSTGALVVFLDDDMELAPGFLRAHRDFHHNRGPAVGVGNVINHPEVTAAPIDRYMSTRGAQKIQDRGPLPWRYFTTNNSSVMKADLDAVGGFDERFVTYGFEDLELGLRLAEERKLPMYFVREARSYHIHPHTLEEVLAKKTLSGRSSLRVLFEKHPEVRVALGYPRFDPARRGDPLGLNLTRMLFRTLFTPPVYRALKPLARIELGGVTDRVLDYLVQYHYLEGLRMPRIPEARGAESR
jgi:glycosyltransferase involved in cell wall biosynthesis